MKRFILSALLVVIPAYAAANPEVLQLKNDVTFQHKRHQSNLKGECKNCHRKERNDVNSGQIDNFGKDNAHRMCRTCHTIKSAGPVNCKGCHKKA